MRLEAKILFVLLWTSAEGTGEPRSGGNASVALLSRQRRYIVFPKGASLQLVYCNTYLFRPVVDIFRFGTTVGLAWQLPDDPQIYSESKKKHKIYKRNAFKKMEAFMRPGGADGKQCVLRALCESGQRTTAKKAFLGEILHKIFSYDEEDAEDHGEDALYRRAHRSTNQNCHALYPGCPFSLFGTLQ